MRLPFQERLSAPGVIVADGATGSMMMAAGLPGGVPPEQWNLTAPEKVVALHQAYLQAGSELVLTNTFGGSPVKLQVSGLVDQIAEINRKAARLARRAAGEDRYVGGDIGPTGKLMQPFGPLAYETAVEAFARQAAALAKGDADVIWIETMSDLNEAKAAVEGAMKATRLPVVVTMSFDHHRRTQMGVKPAQAARVFWDMGAAAVGANCGKTLEDMVAIIQEMRQAAPEAVLVAKPNAGLPRLENMQTVYDTTPQEMADFTRRFIDMGVKVVGGCCGSTPEHVAAIVRAVRG
ncbi:MAG: homocysteine S-methyltransferase family protein [Chloroflexota bacterium]